MKIRVVGDQILVDMFRILGASGKSPEGADETDSTIKSFLSEPDVGLILVGGSHAALLGAKFKNYLQRKELPVVLPVPDRREQKGCADEIREYLQRSLGIRL